MNTVEGEGAGKGSSVGIHGAPYGRQNVRLRVKSKVKQDAARAAETDREGTDANATAREAGATRRPHLTDEERVALGRKLFEQKDRLEAAKNASLERAADFDGKLAALAQEIYVNLGGAKFVWKGQTYTVNHRRSEEGDRYHFRSQQFENIVDLG
jgi:hypothetical protein